MDRPVQAGASAFELPPELLLGSLSIPFEIVRYFFFFHPHQLLWLELILLQKSKVVDMGNLKIGRNTV